MSYIDDDIREIEETFYDLEESHFKTEKIQKPKKIIKRNKLGLTKKETEIVLIILFNGLFIISISSILIGYSIYYFSLPY